MTTSNRTVGQRLPSHKITTQRKAWESFISVPFLNPTDSMSESNIFPTSLPLPYVASFIRSNNRTFLPTNPFSYYISISTPASASHQTPIPLSLSLCFSLHTFLHSSLIMPSSFSPNPISISPSKLRSDLYSFSCEDESSMPLVISVLASLVERTIARNERIVGKCVAVKDARSRAFYSHQVLDMSIQSFLERFFRYARVAPPVYVVAYVYMDRLCQLNPGLKVCLMNVHRLLLTSIMVASKFLEDRNYRNSYFAKVGGISTMELNNLELSFLFLMKFKLHVSVSVFESYCSHLEREVSFGGGYHIERSLKFMCAGEITSKERERRELNQLARVL